LPLLLLLLLLLADQRRASTSLSSLSETRDSPAAESARFFTSPAL